MPDIDEAVAFCTRAENTRRAGETAAERVLVPVVEVDAGAEKLAGV